MCADVVFSHLTNKYQHAMTKTASRDILSQEKGLVSNEGARLTTQTPNTFSRHITGWKDLTTCAAIHFMSSKVELLR